MLEPRLTPPGEPGPLRSRLGWLALYWLGGVAALAAIAGVIRWAL
jgi:hypothetical protein